MNIESTERLRKFRENLKLNQEQIATYLGIGRVAYSSIETGKNGIQDEHLYRLKEKGLSLDWLFSGKGEMLLSDAATVQIGNMNTGYTGSMYHTYNTIGDCEKDVAVMTEKLAAAARELALKDEIILLLKEKMV